MPGIYVHLPFCPYICPYCDFAKWPHKRSAASEYLRALFAEIDAAEVMLSAPAHPAPADPSTIQARRRQAQHDTVTRDNTGEVPVILTLRQAQGSKQEYATVFLGGGTPNTYSANDIEALLQRLRERFPGPENRETTIEVNPELVTLEHLRSYRKTGINRISIGVQSFVAEEIRTLGRRHTPQQVRDVVAAAREAGIRSVSLDLIFAVPGQTPDSWRTSLQTAIDLGVDHVSTYGLTVEAGTPYERWQQREPKAFMDDTREAELYDIAISMLERAGFEHYEISNFAKPGHRSAHNANYWANGEYVGLGVGAASYLDGVRSVHTRDLQAYVEAALAKRPIPGESERLEGMQAAGEAVMLALRTAQGLSLEGFKERYGVDFLESYAPAVRRFTEDGLLEVDAARARLTRRGRFLANDVCAAFVTFA